MNFPGFELQKDCWILVRSLQIAHFRWTVQQQLCNARHSGNWS